MGYNHFRFARRIDADTIGFYHDDMTKLLQFDKAIANQISLKGGSPTALDKLIIKSNTTDSLPYIELDGQTYVKFAHGATYGMRILDNVTEYFRFHYGASVPTIQSYPVNSDIQFIPNGDGKVRFGAYTAGVAGDSTGYVTMKDQAGNPRKLMIQA